MMSNRNANASFRLGPFSISFDGKATTLLKLGLVGLGLYGCKKGIDYGYKRLTTNLHDKTKKESVEKSKQEEVSEEPIKRQHPRAKTFREIHNEEKNTPKCKDVIDGIIHAGSFVFIYAEPKQGKSIWSQDTAFAISTGIQPLWNPYGGNVDTQRVLYIDVENGPEVFERRYGYFSDSNNEKYKWADGVFESVDDMADFIENEVFEENTNITVVVDNITLATHKEVSNSMVIDVYHKLSAIRDRAKQNGFYVTYIIVGHTNKDGSYRGGSCLRQIASLVLRLKGTDKPDIKELVFENDRNGTQRPPILMKLVTEPYHHFEAVDDTPGDGGNGGGSYAPPLGPTSPNGGGTASPQTVVIGTGVYNCKAPNQTLSIQHVQHIVTLNNDGVSDDDIAYIYRGIVGKKQIVRVINKYCRGTLSPAC